MIIRPATNNEAAAALTIAADLKPWFNKTGLKNMKTDFRMNNLLIAKEKRQVYNGLGKLDNPLRYNLVV